MSKRFALVRDRRGTAAAEMALVTPLLLIIMLGSMELGNYFYNQHTLVKSVRDAARFAARQRMSNYTTCPGSPPQAIIDDTKTVARKGYLDSTANDLLPNWASATFSVTMTCTANLTDSGGGTLTFGGTTDNNTGRVLVNGGTVVFAKTSTSAVARRVTRLFGRMWGSKWPEIRVVSSCRAAPTA